MAKVTLLERKFVLVKGDEKIDLPEINPTLSVEEVKDIYANTYPELINCNIQPQGIQNDKDVYHFSTIAGTKG